MPAYRDLLQALSVALESLDDPDCRSQLGPLVAGATMTHGARVPGTSYELDPAMAAYNLGLMLGWPRRGAADAPRLAAILPVTDYLSRRAHHWARPPLCVGDLLGALVEAARTAHRSATAMVLTRLLGGGADHVLRVQTLGTDTDADAGAAARAAPSPWSVAESAARAVRQAFLAVRAQPALAPALPDDKLSAAFAIPGADAAAAYPAAATGPEAIGALAASVSAHYPAKQAALVRARLADRAACVATPVHEFIALLVRNA